jgi:hypothetical protein
MEKFSITFARGSRKWFVTLCSLKINWQAGNLTEMHSGKTEPINRGKSLFFLDEAPLVWGKSAFVGDLWDIRGV